CSFSKSTEIRIQAQSVEVGAELHRVPAKLFQERERRPPVLKSSLLPREEVPVIKLVVAQGGVDPHVRIAPDACFFSKDLVVAHSRTLKNEVAADEDGVRFLGRNFSYERLARPRRTGVAGERPV